jgi:ankyrin repeat protein
MEKRIKTLLLSTFFSVSSIGLFAATAKDVIVEIIKFKNEKTTEENVLDTINLVPKGEINLFLYEEDPDKNIGTSELGRSPLCHAADIFPPSEAIIKALLKKGAWVDRSNVYTGENPLTRLLREWASWRNITKENKVKLEEIALLFIKKGANVNNKVKIKGLNRTTTPLHEAVKLNNTKIINSLIKNGANVNARIERGELFRDETPLHLAVFSNAAPHNIINILVDNGAITDIPNIENETPYQYASRLSSESSSYEHKETLKGNLPLLKETLARGQTIKSIIEKIQKIPVESLPEEMQAIQQYDPDKLTPEQIKTLTEHAYKFVRTTPAEKPAMPPVPTPPSMIPPLPQSTTDLLEAIAKIEEDKVPSEMKDTYEQLIQYKDDPSQMQTDLPQLEDRNKLLEEGKKLIEAAKKAPPIQPTPPKEDEPWLSTRKKIALEIAIGIPIAAITAGAIYYLYQSLKKKKAQKKRELEKEEKLLF